MCIDRPRIVLLEDTTIKSIDTGVLLVYGYSHTDVLTSRGIVGKKSEGAVVI